MPPRVDPKAVFCARLKQAREAAGLSQKELGILAGIDQFVASTRINRYEKGVHEADVQTASRLADSLKIPLAYLYAKDDRLARMILGFAQLSRDEQDVLLKKIEGHRK